MNPVQHFEAVMNKKERSLLARLASPVAIQAFLDSIPYKVDVTYQAPLGVIRTREANCFDGGLFAAAALRRLGQRPVIIYMLASDDDDHTIALYKRNNCLGAIAKSNYVGLRFREAIYRDTRELLMSYFEIYFNLKREKTLRAYTHPLNLTSFDRISWMTSNDAIETISCRLDTLKRHSLVTASIAESLSLIDKRSYEANMLNVNMEGVYKPNRRK